MPLSTRYHIINDTQMGEWIAGACAKAAAKLASTRMQAETDFEAELASLEKQLGLCGSEKEAPRTEADLLAAVYAAPDDDAPRLVYADFLLERDDPRGEFIALQVRAVAGPRPDGDKALERWSIPLSTAGDVTFERGFPISIKLSKEGLKRALGHPSWSTIRKIEGLGNVPQRDAALLLDDPACARIRSVETVHAAVARKLRAATFGWIEASLTDPWKRREGFTSELVARFPRVTRLHYHEGTAAPPSDVLAPLRELASLHIHNLSAFTTAHLANHPSLRALTLAWVRREGGPGRPRQLEGAAVHSLTLACETRAQDILAWGRAMPIVEELTSFVPDWSDVATLAPLLAMDRLRALRLKQGSFLDVRFERAQGWNLSIIACQSIGQLQTRVEIKSMPGCGIPLDAERVAGAARNVFGASVETS